jgi:hypothetical protein
VCDGVRRSRYDKSMIGRVLALVAIATAARAAPPSDGGRARVEHVMAVSLAGLKDCGRHPRAVFDWDAYDALDWITVRKDPTDFLSSERATVQNVGRALDLLCSEPAHRRVIDQLETISYRPSDDRTIRLVAQVAGTTLTFTDNVFGGTRSVGNHPIVDVS